MNQINTRAIRDEQGFTLIELLVVILIIGILAAIAIPSFLNQRAKGQDTCAKSQTRTMATAMEAFYTDTAGYTATMDTLANIEQAVTGSGACGNNTSASISHAAPDAAGVCDDGSGSGSWQSYCVSQSSPSGASFAVYRAANSAPIVRRCGPAARQGQGACPTGGIW